MFGAGLVVCTDTEGGLWRGHFLLKVKCSARDVEQMPFPVAVQMEAEIALSLPGQIGEL